MGLSLAAMIGREASVSLVVRDPERARAIERDGVNVVGLMEAAARPEVVGSIAELDRGGPPEAIFVATKTTAIDAVARELAPLLKSLPPEDQPIIVSFQNGIEPGRDLSRRLADACVVRMVINYGATQVDETTACVMLNAPPHFIGGPDRRHISKSQRLAALLTRCGLPTEQADDIEPCVWTKGILNAAMNPVAALTNASVGEVLDSPARAIVARLIDEGLAVAERMEIDLGPEIVLRMRETLERARAHTPSMVGDIRSGRPSEVGQLNRQIIEHAGRCGVSVPSHEVIAALIDAFDWRVFHRPQWRRTDGVRPGPRSSAAHGALR